MSNTTSLIFYITTFIISGSIFRLYENKNPIIRKISICLTLAIPTLLSAFRFQVGTDYSNYDFLFNYLREHTWKHILVTDIKWEIGFKILVKWLATIGNNQFIFGTLSLLTLCFFIYSLKYYESCDIQISYFIYLFFYFWGALNIVRQSLALAIIFYAYHFIFENKKFKFYLYVFLATTIHTSAIIILPIYYIWNHKKNKTIAPKLRRLILCFFVIGTCIWRTLLQIFIESGWKFAKKFTYLLSNNNGLNRDIFVKIIILLVFIIFEKKYRKNNKQNELFIYLFVFNCIISFTGYQITFFKRIALYFEMPFLILIGRFPFFFSKGGSRLLVKCLIIFVGCMYFILGAFVLGHAEIIPYQWR